MVHVLLIEDDPTIRSALIRALGERGHAVSSAATGGQGLQLAMAEHPDLVVLDLGLPDLDGREVLAMLRAVDNVPVIVATARDGDPEIVAALEAGADDYLVKPFSGAQLYARIGAVLRRAGSDTTADPTVVVAGLRIDPRSREAVLDESLLELTPREFDLLYFLAARAGQVVSKRELSTQVWQAPYGGADKTVDVHLSWLRRKLGETAQEPRYIHTVRGVGVKLTPPPA
ncbi:MAG TPA: response regulator transcription factor [Jiangellaceae bacterium]|nr:response regulator transcription factor [Jiangellaceae bacterium]